MIPDTSMAKPILPFPFDHCAQPLLVRSLSAAGLNRPFKKLFAYSLFPYFLPNIYLINFSPPGTLISYMNRSDFGINDAIIYYIESINKLITLCLICL